MKVKLWGTRGSVASPGPDTEVYGGNTACVEVRAQDGTVLILDAGTGIRRLGQQLVNQVERVDILLTHLHMDHVQGLAFFAPLYNPDIEVRIWGPASTTLNLRARLHRYLSPPLFPVVIQEIPGNPHFHEVPCPPFEVGPFRVSSALVCHPGPTVGYRVEADGQVLAYLPDHEPAMGVRDFPIAPEWTSGYGLAEGADLLIHDAQYNREQYERYVGWGHCSLHDAIRFGQLAQVGHLVTFHHDPSHNDQLLNEWLAREQGESHPPFPVTAGMEGSTFDLDALP